MEELEEQGVQVRVRKWQWYDKKDEEEAQLRETSVMRPHAGYYHLQNVPQSMRKMNRVLAVVRTSIVSCRAWALHDMGICSPALCNTRVLDAFHHCMIPLPWGYHYRGFEVSSTHLLSQHAHAVAHLHTLTRSEACT